ncbi:TIM barrel protein [Rubrivirga sp.]|uniref:TIM barrel protein n=1 Tax=Rubrivirga sp. TaxID=1885344 RepID=UPI003B515E28
MTTAWTTDAATGDPARAVRLTLFWGLDGVALRTVGGGRVPDVTEGPLRRRLDQAELAVVALDPGLFEGDAGSRATWLNEIDRLDEVAAFGERFGCGLARVGALAAEPSDASADALRQAGDRAAALGLALAVRNDAGTAVATGAALAALLGAVGHPAVGADWRPADALAAGEAPADGLEALVSAGVPVRCVGVRDGAVVDGGWADASFGEGDVGWDAHLAALVRAGADGPLVIDALPEPARTSGLGAATALIRSARRALRGTGRG